MYVCMYVRCLKNSEPAESFHGNQISLVHFKRWDDLEEITLCSTSNVKYFVIHFKNQLQKMQHCK